MDIAAALRKVVKGEVDDTPASLDEYSHDASMFEIRPKVVVSPKDGADVAALVKFVSDHKAELPGLSLTARAGGTDMSGGAINDSIIVDFSRHFTGIGSVTGDSIDVQPGAYYRDFEKVTLEQGLFVPSYPASRDLCTVGGMVNNNSGGEKSLRYGKTENYVKRLKVVLADGNEYELKPLDTAALKAKLAEETFEGQVYRQMHELLEKNYDRIKAAKPHVTKNSTGYNLWDVWDRDRGVFDLTKLVVGAQGTLGFVTDIEFALVPKAEHSGLLVTFMPDTKQLGDVINTVLTHQPESFESFDDHTLYLSLRFLPDFHRTLGWWGLVKLLVSLIPDGLMLLRGIPRLILLIEFTGQTPEEVKTKIDAMKRDLSRFHMAAEEDATEAKAKKFWIMRRESFNLLRHKVKDKHTAPFIDDLVVAPQHLPEFLPKLRQIIKKYKLLATVAGHMGDGNFHIIPLMRLEDRDERAKLQPAMHEVFDLVLHYHGSLSGEHNDGLIRGPFLKQMYGGEVLALFRQTKSIFDPHNVFNPHKKVMADWDFSQAHIREHF